MQRLSGLDASFLYLENNAQLNHVSGLIILDVSVMEGGYEFSKLKRELARRVKGMPAFRKKLHDSLFNLDHPVWVEDTEFDIDQHIHRVAVPAPGDDIELAKLCSHFAGVILDRRLPLWEMWVIEGLADGRVAVFSKMHHATVDGVTGANMMSQLCTLSEEHPELDPELVKENAGGASLPVLAADGILKFAARPFQLLKLLPSTLSVIPEWIARARRDEAMPAPFSAPRTSFNGTITAHRSIAYTGVSLTEIKEIKNVFGTTVNDVVMTLVAGSLRRYLDERGELPDTSLLAMVPISVHGKADDRPGTNRVSGMFAKLFTDIQNPAERLRAVHAANNIAKQHQEALDANLLTDWAQFAAPSVFGSAVRAYSHLRMAERHPVVYNLVISNVPGPPVPLYFLGARISRMFPLGPVYHGAGLNVTVMSLEDRVDVGFIGCRELAPDLWPMARHFDAALADLLAEARALSGSPDGAIDPEPAAKD